MVLCSCHPSYGKKHKIGRYQSKLAQPGQKLRSYLKTNREQKDGDVAQAVECLHSKHKALSSNPSTTTKKKVVELQKQLNSGYQQLLYAKVLRKSVGPRVMEWKYISYNTRILGPSGISAKVSLFFPVKE
jgi:hypothetical protein